MSDSNNGPSSPEKKLVLKLAGGTYILRRSLGRGAYGEVWLAEAPGGVEVALKIIHRAVKAENAQRELEALQVIKKLRHQNLLCLQAFFPAKNRLIIVMELADRSLRDRLQECRTGGAVGIPPQELTGYCREVAEALDFLNTHRIQHRDVKPDNLLLVGRHVKVADCGLARMLEEHSLQTASTVGTPAFMPPEVWKGKVSQSSDQYSLATSYVELRLGRFPFPYHSVAQLVDAHLHEVPQLEELGVGEREAVLKALAKEPAARFSSCSEFVLALEAGMAQDSRATIAVDRIPAVEVRCGADATSARGTIVALEENVAPAPVLAPSPGLAHDTSPAKAHTTETDRTSHSPKWRRDARVDGRTRWHSPRVLCGIAGFLVLGLAWIIVNTASDGEPMPSAGDHALGTKTDKEETKSGNAVALGPAEPDAKQAKDIKPSKSEQKAGVKAPAPLQTLEITNELRQFEKLGSSEMRHLWISPDAKFAVVGEANTGMVRVYDIVTGKHLRAIDTSEGISLLSRFRFLECLAVSADLKYLATGKNDNQFTVWDFASGSIARTFSGHTGWVRGLYFCHDNKRILSAGDDATLRTWDIASGKQLSVIQFSQLVPSIIHALDVSKDGTRAAIVSSDLRTRVWDLVKMVEIRSFSHESIPWTVGFSPDGMKICVSTFNERVVTVWDVESGIELLRLPHEHVVWSIAFSPDGHRLVTGGGTLAQGDALVRIFDANTGKEVRRLDKSDNGPVYVAYSPDGRYLLSGGRNGVVSVWGNPELEAKLIQEQPKVSAKMPTKSTSSQLPGLRKVDLLKPVTSSILSRDLVLDLGGAVKMKFVRIEPGTFAMGSPADEEGRESDESQREVKITKAFYMSVYEVTQAQYERLMGKNPSWFSATGNGKKSVQMLDTTDFPVEMVSWDEAIEFCTKATTLPHAKAQGWLLELPTEAEWEYACRAGTRTAFYFGPNISTSLANIDQGFTGRTAKVGTFSGPNPWGLYDMHGNVWEWCKDSFKYTADFKNVRGGSWGSFPRHCRAAFARPILRNQRGDNLGFRVVLRVP